MSSLTDVQPEGLMLVPAPGLLERNARLIALLDSFEERDAEVQSREFAALAAALDEDRPGQRRIFGTGINP